MRIKLDFISGERPHDIYDERISRQGWLITLLAAGTKPAINTLYLRIIFAERRFKVPPFSR